VHYSKTIEKHLLHVFLSTVSSVFSVSLNLILLSTAYIKYMMY